MKLVSFRLSRRSAPRAGVLLPIGIVDIAAAAPLIFEDTERHSWDMLSLLRNDAEGYGISAVAQIIDAMLDQIGELSGDELLYVAPEGPMSVGGEALIHPIENVRLLPPLPNPPTLRDFYAFEQHVATAYGMRGREVPKAWYRMPVFYFGNPGAIYGHGEPVPMPRTRALDYELEIACVIGREGVNISEDEAESYIAGYTIMNDWSARDVQAEEMSVGLGPAKGKDFATSLGPALITPDELEEHATGDGRYDLEMIVLVNGAERGRGNLRDIHYTFAQMIAHASRDVVLRPGDVIGSGTVGTGCLLETTNNNGPWLQVGDVVQMEVEGLGVLRNRVASYDELEDL